MLRRKEEYRMEQNIVIDFNNERLERILTIADISYHAPKGKEANYFSLLEDHKRTDEIVCESLLGQYAYDVFVQGAAQKSILDFSYGSLPNLPIGLQGVLQGYLRDGETVANSARSVAKSFAAYLFLLTIKEHDCHLRGEEVNSIIKKSNEDPDALWLFSMHIYTGVRREIDLLPWILGGLKIMRTERNRIVFFDIDPLVSAYRSAFRIDLKKQGLTNIALEAK